MNIYSYLVTRNEAGRYLKTVLDGIVGWADGLVVYDDQSTDETVQIVRHFGGVTCFVRPDDVPSFMEHEAQFREAAWRAMEDALKPQSGDWIVTLDADEFLRRPPSRRALQRLATIGFDGVRSPVHECWGSQDGDLQIRTDGFWGKITAVRACLWQPDGVFADRSLAGGSVPSYVTKIANTNDISIVHLGYFRAEDRQSKYERYVGKPGHNPKHISSILAKPTLDILENIASIQDES